MATLNFSIPFFERTGLKRVKGTYVNEGCKF